MSKQIAVRLPDDLVDFVDGLIAAGAATSRADVVARALHRERRRAAAARDAEIYAQSADAGEFDAMHEYLRAQPLDLE